MKSKSKSRVPESQSPEPARRAASGCPALDPRPSTLAAPAFTLVEMLVTLALLSLIVLALMAVFNSTQKAFRASLTQTDMLESGRMAMGLIASDLEAMTPSYGSIRHSDGFASPRFCYTPMMSISIRNTASANQPLINR